MKCTKLSFPCACHCSGILLVEHSGGNLYAVVQLADQCESRCHSGYDPPHQFDPLRINYYASGYGPIYLSG